MVKSCAAYNCTNRVFKNCGISFHSFPKDENIRKKWLIAMRRDKYQPSDSARLCSDHFVADDFIYQFGRKIVKKDAVPSLFKFPEHLIKKKSKPRSARLAKYQIKNVSSDLIKNEEPSVNMDFMTESSNSREPTSTKIIEDNLSVPCSPSKKRRRNPVYFGDCNADDLKDPKKAKLMWAIATKTIEKQRQNIKYLQTRNRRLKKKIVSLTELLQHLKTTKKISADCYSLLQECIPESQKQILLKQMKIATNKQYPQELRCFALTLNFYSSAAYNYVRRIYGNCLPHPSTLRKWYSSIDGSPGYTKESLQAVQLKVEEFKCKNEQLVCGLQMDEMSIKQHVEWNGKRQIGYINYGYQMESDSLPLAKDALVFLLVGLNCRWKIPIGYFLISGLSAEEKANLVKGCFVMLNNTGVKVVSLTFDGAASNISMARILGAEFTYSNLKTFFSHPVTQENIYIIMDPCHMIKLIRNALGDLEELRDEDNNSIRWFFFKALVEIQEKYGLHLATKITNRHLNYYKEKMNVKLAVQVFSSSTSDALKFCNNELKLVEFQDAEHTSKFCLIMDRLFDVLNTRNTLSKNPFKRALSPSNFVFIKQFFQETIAYISKLRTIENINILESRRKMGFLGMIITMKSIESIIEEYICQKQYLKYLLSYKLSQDHIELFFSAVRARGGFNNNPTARQFEGAYKRLLVHVELKTSENANCTPQSDISILNVSCSNNSQRNKSDFECFLKEYNTSQQGDNIFDDCFFHFFDIDCLYINNVIEYIAGFIVRKLFKIIDCNCCRNALIKSNNSVSGSLLNIKNKGKLFNPSFDLIKICKSAEKMFRLSPDIKNMYELNSNIIRTFRQLENQNLFPSLSEHILEHDPIDNHRNILMYLIVKTYFIIRIHYKNKKLNEVPDRIRHCYSKLIHFKHQ